MKNKIVKDALLLTLITLVSGCILGLVYQITKAPIAQAQEDATQTAYKEVFEDADSFEKYVAFSADDAAAALEEATTADYDYMNDDTINGCVEAKDASGNTLGYVITITTHAGYGGDITFSIGVQNDGTLNGYSITTINETAGLGMKSKEPAFENQFNDKNVEEFAVTKTGSTSDSEIDAISGATITSKAVTNGVDAGLVYFRSIAEGGSTNE